jgi:mRNA interferase MazF
MRCSRNDIVLLPIPFSDLTSSKVRPAIVVGQGSFPGDMFVVPVTSQLSNADFVLINWQQAGLNVPSAVKGQISTVEDRLVRKVIGRLSTGDIAVLDKHLRHWLCL